MGRVDTSFFELKKMHGAWHLFINKEIKGRRNKLLAERSEVLGSLVRKCRLNGPFGHLQRNAK